MNFKTCQIFQTAAANFCLIFRKAVLKTQHVNENTNLYFSLVVCAAFLSCCYWHWRFYFLDCSEYNEHTAHSASNIISVNKATSILERKMKIKSQFGSNPNALFDFPILLDFLCSLLCLLWYSPFLRSLAFNHILFVWFKN